MSINIVYCFFSFLILHIAVWFSTNLQLMDSNLATKSFVIALALSVPTTVLAYMGTKFGYVAFGESAWSVRFFAFATSYLVFPILTWVFLGESMFTVKTMLCVLLSFLIIAIQMYL